MPDTIPDAEPSAVREFADRATLWLLESPENLRQLLRLVATEIAAHLDFSRAERINRSFIPDNLQKQEPICSTGSRTAMAGVRSGSICWSSINPGQTV